jgi:hypothetical protein
MWNQCEVMDGRWKTLEDWFSACYKFSHLAYPSVTWGFRADQKVV